MKYMMTSTGRRIAMVKSRVATTDGRIEQILLVTSALEEEARERRISK